jgi:predicted nuclease with TOPRIM domain
MNINNNNILNKNFEHISSELDRAFKAINNQEESFSLLIENLTNLTNHYLTLMERYETILSLLEVNEIARFREATTDYEKALHNQKKKSLTLIE